MATEQEFRELLTDKLIEVAEHPEMRKKFSVIYETGAVDADPADDDYSGGVSQILFFKNQPMMSNVERHAVVLYLLGRSNEETFAKVESLIDEIEDEWDKATLTLVMLKRKAEYYQQIGDEDAYWQTITECFHNSALFTGMGDVYVDNLEEYYDFLVEHEVWGVVYDFIANLFAVTEQVGAPLSDPNYLLEIHKDFERDELDFLRKVYKDVYIEKIIPEEFYDPEIRLTCFASEESEKNICDIFAYSISVAYRYVRAASRPKPGKGSFDYLYNNAEKGDKKAMAAIAEAYRTGTGTHANQRLADYWQKRSE